MSMHLSTEHLRLLEVARRRNERQREAQVRHDECTWAAQLQAQGMTRTEALRIAYRARMAPGERSKNSSSEKIDRNER